MSSNYLLLWSEFFVRNIFIILGIMFVVSVIMQAFFLPHWKPKRIDKYKGEI